MGVMSLQNFMQRLGKVNGTGMEEEGLTIPGDCKSLDLI
jgi:hypothetical protein